MSSTSSQLTPAVSVLMPVRNGARHIGLALDSLRAQTFTNFEIIIVDNGSTDATPALLREWAEREPRIRVVEQPHAGLSQSLNHAASLARASLLARLDSDDLALPQRLARQVAVMMERPQLGVLGSAAELIDEQGREVGELRPGTTDHHIRNAHRTSCSLIATSTIMRREVFFGCGGYRLGLNISEDYDLWARAMEQCEVANLDEKLVRYRVHRSSVTTRQPVRMVLASMCVVAAIDARSTGVREPFSAGVPNLRLALPLLGISRARSRRIVRLRALGNRFNRRLMISPIGPFWKFVSWQMLRRLGLHAFYHRWLKSQLSRRMLANPTNETSLS